MLQFILSFPNSHPVDPLDKAGGDKADDPSSLLDIQWKYTWLQNENIGNTEGHTTFRVYDYNIKYLKYLKSVDSKFVYFPTFLHLYIS